MVYKAGTLIPRGGEQLLQSVSLPRNYNLRCSYETSHLDSFTASVWKARGSQTFWSQDCFLQNYRGFQTLFSFKWVIGIVA